jgi:hypothetical protein
MVVAIATTIAIPVAVVVAIAAPSVIAISAAVIVAVATTPVVVSIMAPPMAIIAITITIMMVVPAKREERLELRVSLRIESRRVRGLGRAEDAYGQGGCAGPEDNRKFVGRHRLSFHRP